MQRNHGPSRLRLALAVLSVRQCLLGPTKLPNACCQVHGIDFADSSQHQGRLRGDVACRNNTQEYLVHNLLTGEIRELQH